MMLPSRSLLLVSSGPADILPMSRLLRSALCDARQCIAAALAALVAAVLCAPTLAQTQSFPSKPLRLIAPYPAGGTTDMMARLAAQKMSEQFKPRALQAVAFHGSARRLAA